MMVYMLSKLNC